jgi:hypothetical protein
MEFELHHGFYRFLAEAYHAEQLVDIPDSPVETELAASPLGAYCESWAGKSLSLRLEEAQNSRQKGNFNAAVAAVTNVAKDHVKSLREVQCFFDDLAGREKTLVILSKFKQTFPLELGIDHGDDVLELVETCLAPWKEQQGMNIHDLMESERRYYYEQEKLQVFERVYAGEAEAQELKEQAAELASARKDLCELKTQLGIGLLGLGHRFLTLRCRQARDRHVERGAAEVVHADFVAELHAVGVAAVLATDADLQLSAGATAALDVDLDQLADVCQARLAGLHGSQDPGRFGFGIPGNPPCASPK